MGAPEWAPVLYKLTLPATEARVLFRLLGEAGVSAASVYPGLDGAAKAIRERRRRAVGATWQSHASGGPSLAPPSRCR